MSFIESPRFPDDISQGSRGSANYSTDVVTVKSGYEVRNANWVESRRSYDASFGVRSDSQLYDLLEYFHAMLGRANTFRFKDWADYKSVATDQVISSTDQLIGTGDSVEVDFQLVKKYTQGLTTQRDIKKPVDGSVLVSIADLDEPNNFTVNSSTGVVTFDADTSVACSGATATNPAVLGFAAHGLASGDTLFLSGFTGDWAALNGVRYTVTVISVTNISVEVDATLFTAYSANGGNMNTIPQTSEQVKAGYEFDVPCRFDTDTMTRTFDNYQSGSIDVPIVEVRI